MERHTLAGRSLRHSHPPNLAPKPPMSAHLHPHIVCEAPRGIVHRVEREVVNEGVAVAPVVLQPDESGEWVALECGLAAAVTGQQDAAPHIYRWGWSPCCRPPCCTIPASATASTPHAPPSPSAAPRRAGPRQWRCAAPAPLPRRAQQTRHRRCRAAGAAGTCGQG